METLHSKLSLIVHYIFTVAFFIDMCYGLNGFDGDDFTKSIASHIGASIDERNYRHHLLRRHDSSISEECFQNINYLSNSTLGLIFIDATGKIPVGIMSGNMNSLGQYDQCINIQYELEGSNIFGKYCTVPFILDMAVGGLSNSDMNKMENLQRPKLLRRTDMSNYTPLKGTIGICIPKSCGAEIFDYLLENMTIPIIFSFNESVCRYKAEFIWTTADWIAASVFGSMFVITICSTLYEIHHIFYKKKDAASSKEFLRSFSLYKNSSTLFTFKSSPNSIDCLVGIRAVSTLWVILGHSYFVQLEIGSHLISNMVDVLNWTGDLAWVWVQSALLAVDTFLFMGGLLLTYTAMRKFKSQRALISSVPIFWLQRLLRTTPSLAVIILFTVSFAKFIGDGPYTGVISDTMAQFCHDNWWAALLHIQNYVSPMNLCVGHSWYLCIDTQLYLVSPLLLVFLIKRGSVAIGSMLIALAAAVATVSAYVFTYNWSGSILLATASETFTPIYYTNTLTRCPPFIVGVIFGYILFTRREIKARIPKVIAFCLWMMSIATMGLCVFGMHTFNQPDHDDQLKDNLFNAYHRTAWAFCLGWLVYACSKGYGGPVNWVLCWGIWKFPARISYAMYLIHFPMQMMFTAGKKNLIYFGNFNTMYIYFGDVMMTVILSTIFVIAVEYPFANVQKLFLQGAEKDKMKSDVESGTKQQFKSVLKPNKESI